MKVLVLALCLLSGCAVLETFGPGGFIAAKVGVTLLFLHYYPDISSDVVILVNGVTCAVAAHNLRVASQLPR